MVKLIFPIAKCYRELFCEAEPRQRRTVWVNKIKGIEMKRTDSEQETRKTLSMVTIM